MHERDAWLYRQASYTDTADMEIWIVDQFDALNHEGSWYLTPSTWMTSHWLDQKLARQEEDHLNIEKLTALFVIMPIHYLKYENVNCDTNTVECRNPNV